MILQKGVRIRHLTRGSTYEIEGVVTVQHSGGDRSLDGECLVTYIDITTRRLYARPSAEFEGRFEVI